MKVRVYRNLHKRCFSVQDYKTKRVIDRIGSGLILNPIFKVSQAGRDRVVREKRKNVHAFIVGCYEKCNGIIDIASNNLIRITYDPYIHDGFGCYTDGKFKVVKSANYAILYQGQFVYVPKNGVVYDS